MDIGLNAEVQIQVPFHDVDMLNVTWHGHYAKYFEIARCALLDRIDYNYLNMRDTGFVWPVIDLHIRYVAPATFGQRITVKATLVEYEYRLKINYLITDTPPKTRIAKGHTVQVAVDVDTREMCYASPAVLLDKLHSFNRGASHTEHPDRR